MCLDVAWVNFLAADITDDRGGCVLTLSWSNHGPQESQTLQSVSNLRIVLSPIPTLSPAACAPTLSPASLRAHPFSGSLRGLWLLLREASSHFAFWTPETFCAENSNKTSYGNPDHCNAIFNRDADYTHRSKTEFILFLLAQYLRKTLETLPVLNGNF